jgi:RHS repeat-associated protein
MQPIVSGASYLPSGPPDSLELGNGLTETRAFDARYHPDRITVAGGSTLLDWDYATDDVGNIQAISDVLDAVNDRTYGYQDYQYFLTQGDGPWGGLDWTYDTIGNRLSEARDGQPADVYDYLENGAGGNLPQLDAIQLGGGGTRAYLHDEVGNQTQVATGANVVDFTYDDASRLAGIERASASASASLLYDGRSFLRFSNGSQPDTTGDGVFCDGFESGDTSAWPSGIGGCREARATRPVYGLEGMLHSLGRTANVGASLADRYVFYFGSRPVASMELVGGSATFQYLSVDHLGTPILATDGSGGSVWIGGFEPFGLDWQAGTPDGPRERGVFLRFPGQWLDETWTPASMGTEVVYNVHRWYDPGTGRYTRPDPMGLANSSGVASGLGYAYADADPLRFTDPLGLFKALGTPAEASRIENAMERIRRGLDRKRRRNRDCCTSYFANLNQDLDALTMTGGPPFITFASSSAFGGSTSVCGKPQTGPPFTYIFINKACFQRPDPCKLASVILHEMGHNARRDSHDNEPPEFFRKCNLGCAQPGRFQ